jgi:16S rRNA (uracil1498-N3)-methyltransferase
MLPRFYVPNITPQRETIILTDREMIHQITDVLRLKKNDVFIVFSDQTEYEVILKEITKDTVTATVLESHVPSREPKRKLTLYQSLLKSDKFEWILQKGVELGVHRFVPIISDSCVVREISQNKQERYHKIIAEATEQCGGLHLAELMPALPFTEALGQANNATGQKLLAWENEHNNRLKQQIDETATEFHLFVGSEGGFTAEEIKSAADHGITTVSMGRRILRAETAAIAAVCSILLNA